MAGHLIQYTGTLTGQVGSLITALDAILVTGAGWTKAYSGTNKAAYYNNAASAAHCYLRVDDNATGTGGAKEALATGYETMSDVDTGTGPFPTTALGAGGTIAALPFRKSASADGTVRDWIAYADAATIHFFCHSGDVAGGYSSFSFGKFDSKSITDTWCNWIVGNYTQNNSPSTDQFTSVVASPNYNALDGAGRGCAQRLYTGAANAVSIRRFVDTALTAMAGNGPTSGVYMGVGTLLYPNAADLGLYLTQVRLAETSGTFRGTLRGIWSSCHPVASFNDGDTFSGSGTLAGKAFRVIKSSAAGGLWVVETSATLSNA